MKKIFLIFIAAAIVNSCGMPQRKMLTKDKKKSWPAAFVEELGLKVDYVHLLNQQEYVGSMNYYLKNSMQPQQWQNFLKRFPPSNYGYILVILYTTKKMPKKLNTWGFGPAKVVLTIANKDMKTLEASDLKSKFVDLYGDMFDYSLPPYGKQKWHQYHYQH